MIPVVDHQKYRIAIDPHTNIVFLLFQTLYQGQTETVAIQLPDNPWRTYTKNGHEEFMSWVKRIDEDYQVGRFSKDNPRLWTEYQLASAEEVQAIVDCFEKRITLIQQEALRLLFSLRTTYSNLAVSCISEILAQGKSITIEIFCLMFRFFEEPILKVENPKEKLIVQARYPEDLIRFDNNPVAGCPDAAKIVLGLLTRRNDPYKAFFQLAHLHTLKAEFNFRYLKDRLDFYIEQIEKLKEDENEMPHMENLVHQFRREFPTHQHFTIIKEKEYLPHWLFMEQALSWERDCHDCLEKCFLAFNIKLDYEDLQNLLHLPSGRDWGWHSYSVGQEIKYCPMDPAEFTKDSVKKPKMPVAGYEDYILGVWQHYLRFFKPDLTISRENLETIFSTFVQEWNGK